VSEEHRVAFAAAFLAQARSDWHVYQLLAATDKLPACHALHYRQAACLHKHRAICASAARFAREIEKLAPAVDRATSPENAEYPC
jgi:hypothetical protein